MSIEATLALAIKKYRNIVDSRRFVPLASEEEFKKVFDAVLLGLLDNLSEAVRIEKESVTETETDLFNESTENNENTEGADNNETIAGNFADTKTDTNAVSDNSKSTETTEISINIDAKRIIVATDILKLLIILKHFINQPVYADETLHEIFDLAAASVKIVSVNPDAGDNEKAKKRFENFIGNLYVFLCEDSSLDASSSEFFRNLPEARLHDVLLEAAPRASHEEIYRKHYRELLLKLSNVSELVPQVIKRLDSYYPEPKKIEGVSRKTFLLEQLGWKHSTVFQCSERINQKIRQACQQKEKEEAFKNVQYFWILLNECKFVAPDEFCATLFIFPSECESFLKMISDLKESYEETVKTFGLDAKQEDAKTIYMLNGINEEISVWVRKLVKAVATNYVHFERDLNNRNYRSSNKILAKIIIELASLSASIYNNLKNDFGKTQLILVKPIGEVKIVADFIEKWTAIQSPIKPFEELKEEALKEENSAHTVIPITTTQNLNDFDKDGQSKLSLWTMMLAILSTIAALFCIKSFYPHSSKH